MALTRPSCMTAICQRARPEILAMADYVSARSLQLPGDETVFLDANECAFEPFVGASGLSRYPAQQPAQLVDAFCRWLDVSSRNLTITRGADEAIDCLMRAFCIPAVDNVVICPPTFAMYAQSAMLQGVAVRSAMLDSNFGLDLAAIEKAVDVNTKMIFVCSPNNPTGNIMDAGVIQKLGETYADKALIIVDETYIEFSNQPSSIAKLDQFANLVVLRTLSKSHAAAGLRCGAAVARGDVTSLLQKVLAPYPLAAPVMQAALTILKPENTAKLAEKRADIVTRRNGYAKEFAKLDDVQSVLPSDANYLLLLVRDAADLCEKARKSGIILRDQSHQPGLENAVRIAIGSAEEMQQLLEVMAGENSPALPAQRRFSVTRKTSETAISVTVNLDDETAEAGRFAIAGKYFRKPHQVPPLPPRGLQPVETKFLLARALAPRGKYTVAFYVERIANFLKMFVVVQQHVTPCNRNSTLPLWCSRVYDGCHSGRSYKYERSRFFVNRRRRY